MSDIQKCKYVLPRSHYLSCSILLPLLCATPTSISMCYPHYHYYVPSPIPLLCVTPNTIIMCCPQSHYDALSPLPLLCTSPNPIIMCYSQSHHYVLSPLPLLCATLLPFIMYLGLYLHSCAHHSNNIFVCLTYS